MSAHSREVVDKFCNLCDWLMQIWQMRKSLFDENPHKAVLMDARYGRFFYLWQEVLQSSWLHELAKLHDPPKQGSYFNLSIDYMIEYGKWDTPTKNQLQELRSRLSAFAELVRDARNKILSHNDREVLLDSKELGGFKPGEDESYFKTLHQFASLVRKAALDEPFVYDDLVKNDVSSFMNTFLHGHTA